MRPIARQSSRLASCSRVRQPSQPRPRCLPQQQLRGFSKGAQQRVDGRGSNEPPNHTKPIDVAREEQPQRNAEADGATHEEPTGADGRKLTINKNRRQRRKDALAPDIPNPPPIPEWFLNHNVKLHEENCPPDLETEGAPVLRCTDPETGHTLFTIPYYRGRPIRGNGNSTHENSEAKQVRAASFKAKSADLLESIKAKNAEVENFMTKKKDRFESMEAKKAAVGNLIETLLENVKRYEETLDYLKGTGETVGGSNRMKENPDIQKARETNNDPSPIDHKSTTSAVRPEAKSESTSILIPPSEKSDEDVNPHSLLRWALLESETSLRAGFTTSATAAQASLVAASRVDLSLLCPDCDSHEQMDEFAEDLAAVVQADLVRLDANDFEDLLADYVGQGSDTPGSVSHLAYDVFDGRASSSRGPGEEQEDEEMDKDEEDEEEDEAHNSSSIFNTGSNSGAPHAFESLRKALFARRHELAKALGNVPVADVQILQPVGANGKTTFRSMELTETQQYDSSRLKALLEQLVDASKIKRDAATPPIRKPWRRLMQTPGERDGKPGMTANDKSYQALFRSYRSLASKWYPDVATVLAQHLDLASQAAFLKLEPQAESIEPPARNNQSRTVVHVRDLRDIASSRTGASILRALIRVVQKRRRSGEEIIIVGTTAQDSAMNMFTGSGQDLTDQEFRTITIPPFFNASQAELARIKPADLSWEMKADSGYHRILEINLRHVQSMLSRLRPGVEVDLFTKSSLSQLKDTGGGLLSVKTLTFDEVQRIVLTAIGLAQSHAISDYVNASHIGLAVFVTSKADYANLAWTKQKDRAAVEDPLRSTQQSQQEGNAPNEKGQARLERIKKSCNQHESRLLPGVVDAQNIKTGFKEVHAPQETIDALKTLTSLSLLRPEAFKYGVLAADRLPGLMLYGPPGTGKTLLAKAVAKESRAAVLEISGAQIYEKYVGEGEKMVRAVFSLAKKLSPCIVFIDEADAIFGSRSSAGNRNTHREIINQFLREWDGMDNHNVFIMVASNRPFDMDDAVLRRLPRRLLVDLPIAQDRESILKIHLKDEILDDTVNLKELAQNTPLYSGSDLKNVCVSAALACVREENELASSKADDKEFKLPEKRTLSARHFDNAIKEISASISEDMTSLTGIRKFDEQYGDRRGRKKKAAYGFGMGVRDVDESAVRVRQSNVPPPTPP